MIATTRGMERRALADGRVLAAWEIRGVQAFAAVPGRAAWIVATHRANPRKLGGSILADFLLLDERRARPRRLLRLPGMVDVVDMRVSPDGRMLAVAAKGHKAYDLQVWNLRSRRVVMRNDHDFVHTMEFTADSRTLVASIGVHCGGDPRVIVWDLGQARTVFTYRGHEASSIRVLGDEARVVVRHDVFAVDLATGQRTEIYKAPCDGWCGVILCG